MDQDPDLFVVCLWTMDWGFVVVLFSPDVQHVSR